MFLVLDAEGYNLILGIRVQFEQLWERTLPALDVRIWMRETFKFPEDLIPIRVGLEEGCLSNAKTV